MNKASIQAQLSVGRPYVTVFRLLASGERNRVFQARWPNQVVTQLVRTSLPDPKGPHANVDRKSWFLENHPFSLRIRLTDLILSRWSG